VKIARTIWWWDLKTSVMWMNERTLVLPIIWRAMLSGSVVLFVCKSVVFHVVKQFSLPPSLRLFTYDIILFGFLPGDYSVLSTIA
jgi:hypothetical protein